MNSAFRSCLDMIRCSYVQGLFVFLLPIQMLIHMSMNLPAF
jgi:hypothetical protein